MSLLLRLVTGFKKRDRLFLGLYLFVCILIVSFLVTYFPVRVSGQSAVSFSVGLGLIGIFIGMIVAVSIRLERVGVWAILLFLGFVGTILTAFYVAGSSIPLVQCSLFTRWYGFPLPWRYVQGLQGNGGCILPLLPLGYSPVRVDWASFLLDVFFFTGAGFALLESSRVTIRSVRRSGNPQ